MYVLALEEEVYSLLGNTDKRLVQNISYTLSGNGFKMYLGGEIVEDARNNVFRPYTRIDLFATPSRDINEKYRERLRQSFIEVLKRHEHESGSDQWMHFGIIVQKQQGWNIKDCYRGDHFYAQHIKSSLDKSEFKLTLALYESSRGEPPPIHLFLCLIRSTN